jgi:hypothetical protein
MIGARIDVLAHVPGMLCFDPPSQPPAASLGAARTNDRAAIAAARAPAMA